jgi:hypothetical protein
MPLVISCATCTKQLRLPETLIGQLVCCPGCQTEFVVRDDSGRLNIQPAAAPAFAPPQPPQEAPDDIPVVRPAPQQAQQRRPPLTSTPLAGGERGRGEGDGKAFKPFTFIVAVVWDPERRLRGELLARVSPYGLQLRDRDDKEYHMPVGTRARYMGANRFMIDLGSRDLTLRVAKRNCQQAKLARHLAAFLNRQRPELRENDYLSAGPARWLALIPLLVVSLFFLPRGGNGWGIMLILAVAAATGLVNFLLLRSTSLALRWRLGGTLGLWVLIAAGVMPLTYVTVRAINQKSNQPLSLRPQYASDGSWQATMPGKPDYRRKWLNMAGGTMFTVETVDLPWNRGKFEILDSDQLTNFQFGAGQEALIYTQAIQDVQISDPTLRVLYESEVNAVTGNRGKEFTLQNNSGVTVKMRVYIAKPRIYIMRVTWQGSLPPGEVDRFLNSLLVQDAGQFIDNGQPLPDPRGPQPWFPGRPTTDFQPQAPNPILNAQLLACFRFDNDPGDLISDSSFNNRHAKLIGGWRIGGVLGKAIMLNGTNDYVDFSNANVNLGDRAPWTIAGWVATNQANGGVVLSMRSSTSPQPMIDVLVDNNGLLLAKVRSDLFNVVPLELRGKKVVSDGVWHHFALVRNADGSIALFQDGELVRLKTALETNGIANGSITTNLRVLGCERWDVVNGLAGPPYFHGCLDEICVYNRALLIGDIKMLAGKQ